MWVWNMDTRAACAARLVQQPGLQIRIHLIRTQIQHFRLNSDPDPIRRSLLGFRIRIRIRNTSVVHPDLDLYVFGPPGSGCGSFYHQAKIVGKTLIPTVLSLLYFFMMFYLIKIMYMYLQSNKQKNLNSFFLAS